MATIGDNIKTLRNSLKLSQENFSKSLEITQSFLSSLEKGRNNPTAEILIRITNIYQVNANWLLTGDGEIFLSEGSPSDISPEHQLLINVYDAASEEARSFALRGLQDSAEKLRNTDLKGSNCAKLNSA